MGIETVVESMIGPVEELGDPTKLTLTQHQIELERLYSKNQLIPRIKAEIQECKEFDFSKYLLEKEIPIAFGLDLLVQMALHKRANLQTLIGLLYHHLKASQATVDMLIKAIEADLVDYDERSEMFIVRFEVSEDVQEELDRFQYPLPMVVEPKALTKNTDSGYYLNQASVILRNNHHNDDVCLDHLNRMNNVRLTINEDTSRMVQNKWKNLDKIKEGETKEEFEQRKKAFAKYDRTAKDVMSVLMQHSDHFFLTHRYDKRGRIYCMGYHVTYQGNAWNKAVIEFADKELVNSI